MAGYLSNNHLGAQVIVYNICFICFGVGYGISMAASTLVGNCIGAGDITLAKRYAHTILKGALIVNFTVAFGLYLFKNPVTSIYVG